jgi:hypothetical protein
MQTLLCIAGLLLADQGGTAIVHGLEPTTRAASSSLRSQQCENALSALIQHFSLPASRKEGLTAVLEAQDGVRVTIGCADLPITSQSTK